jgi:rubrerythrin
MGKMPVTASAVMSFAQRLEEDSAAFYRQLAQGWPEHAELFLGFAKECEKSRNYLTRTYQETISDALEACFCFEGMDLDSHWAEAANAADLGLGDAVTVAVRLEDRASRFYTEAAERSQSLLATIPRAFSRASKMRDKRKSELQSMIQ